MKRLLVCALLLPAVASAAGRDDFAQQWPLTLSQPDAGAYRVELDETVYRHAQDAALRDVAVLDRDGHRVPAAIEAPSAPRAAPQPRPVPWFALPAPDAAAPAGGWSLRTEAAEDGRLRRVEVRSDGGRIPVATPGALLLDVTGLAAPVAFVELAWRPADPLDAGVRVEGSDDLEHWSTIASRGRLLELRQDGRRLVQRRIELIDAPRMRYLRLLPDRPDALTGIVDAQAAPRPPRVDVAPRWLELAPARTVGERGFEYVLDGRFPIREVDVALPGAHAVQWRLASRRDERQSWRPRVADWLGYRVAAGERSPPRVLGQAVRDAHWQLQAGAPVAAAPRLRLGYRPEALVFVAQGQGPYTLVAGSTHPQPASGEAAAVIAALRAAQPPDWQPAAATLGPGHERAGQAALRPVRDWRAWLLWGVLGLGAALVAGFAAHVLRAARPDAG